jgi:hypothetical protein
VCCHSGDFRRDDLVIHPRSEERAAHSACVRPVRASGGISPRS